MSTPAKRGGSLPPDVAPARSLATGEALKPARRVSLSAEGPHAETLATESSSDGHPEVAESGRAGGRAELLAKRGSTLTGSKIRRNCGGSGWGGGIGGRIGAG